MRNCSEMEELIGTIRSMLPEVRLLEHEPMAAHCSFRSGGPARVLAMPPTEGDLLSLLGILQEADVAPLLLGNGTNVVFPDEGCGRFVIGTGALQELAILRLENSDASLSTLQSLLSEPISRSGINHRLARIVDFADHLQHQL